MTAVAMRLGHLRRMGLAELSGRSKQQLLKWLDRFRTVGQSGAHAFDARSVARFRVESPDRFFSGADALCDLTSDTGIGETSTRIVATADRLCDGRFDLLGYRALSFGDPIDWHLDPVSGRRSLLVHWSRLDPLDASAVGDSKVVWELNRHQWLVHLGEAYCLTADERYAAVFADRVQAWMAANPPGIGINWASSLEVALRLIAWSWTLQLFRGSKALTSALVAEMLRWMAIHAAHVERYLSYYFSPNTHLTGEALGLFYAGVVLQDHNRAARWRALGRRILVQQIDRQVHRDGGYFEQSTYYQRYTVEIYLHFLILAARNGVAVPPVVAERVQRMLDFLLSVRHPNGSTPQIGDSDGGWLLPLEARAADDLRGAFSTAAAFFRRADYAWAAEGPTLETLGLLGKEGVKAFGALEPAPPGRAPSCLFLGGEYVVMRNGWAPDAHHLVFDVGPLGCPHSGGHGHADLLSVQCAAFGEPSLVDAGTYSYVDPMWRNFFRGSAAHSTVIVDGVGQAAPAGPFSWKARPHARLRRWVSSDAYDLADAEHDAYRVLADPVVHRRRVVSVKPRYWVVVDDLDGKAEHRVDVGFQFAPMTVRPDRDPWVVARGPAGRGLAVAAWSTVRLERSIVEGGFSPIRGWVSATYGERRPAPVLLYSVVTLLPIRIVSVLVPINDTPANLPTEAEVRSCVESLAS